MREWFWNMDDLEGTIKKEKEKYSSLKKKNQYLGWALVILGVVFGITLSQGGGIAPIAGGLTGALYIGMGVNLLTRSINLKHEEIKAIRDIRMDAKLDILIDSLVESKKELEKIPTIVEILQTEEEIREAKRQIKKQ